MAAQGSGRARASRSYPATSRLGHEGFEVRILPEGVEPRVVQRLGAEIVLLGVGLEARGASGLRTAGAI